MQTLLIILIALVLLGGGYFWYSQQSVDDMAGSSSEIPGLTPPANSDVPVNTGTANTQNTNTGSTNTGTPTGIVQEFTFSNQGFTFTPAAFAVKKGDRVKVTFKNTGGTHDFRIEGYDVGTNVIQAGQSQTFEFVADKAGSFEFYCSVGNHRGMGMKGTFAVAE